jgi:hypothetical protein
MNAKEFTTSIPQRQDWGSKLVGAKKKKFAESSM